MKYGLIGEKLSHSFSAQIHHRLFDYEYELLLNLLKIITIRFTMMMREDKLKTHIKINILWITQMQNQWNLTLCLKKLFVCLFKQNKQAEA